jgi:hypothetical protein
VLFRHSLAKGMQMGVQTLIRIADAFFTISLLLIAVLGIVLAWAMGSLRELSLALATVALLAPPVYRAWLPKA